MAIFGVLPIYSLSEREIARVRLNNRVLYRLCDDGDKRNTEYNFKRKLYFNNPACTYDNITGQEVPGGENSEFMLTNGNVVWIFSGRYYLKNGSVSY